VEKNSNELIELAFARLRDRPGFLERPAQVQLGLVLGDLIEGKVSGAIEAPTGLGKSLASLIPAIAHAMTSRKRIVIATYTNILAEQYWRKDLPLALSLFDNPESVSTAYLMGRQRYACLMAMDEVMPGDVERFRAEAPLGIESDFHRLIKRPARELKALWQAASVPPACAAKACPLFLDCYYYGARRNAQDSNLIITNHSVVIQDALQAATAEDGKGFLGKLDYILFDEAHDLHSAAVNSLEFELSRPRLTMLQSLSVRIERALVDSARANQMGREWQEVCEEFRAGIEDAIRALAAYSVAGHEAGILAASPPSIEQHPEVARRTATQGKPAANEVSELCREACDGYLAKIHSLLEVWDGVPRSASETVRNSTNLIREFSLSAATLMVPRGVGVSFSDSRGQDTLLRQDVVGVDGPMRELFWDRIPSACLSATLTVDGDFEFFSRTIGLAPEFTEVLPSPFDFAHQAALYLPRAGAIPDPSLARKSGTEEDYFWALARELEQIITTMGGRTLALFHSRKEMDAVYARMPKNPELPIYIQQKSGNQNVGERFKRQTESSLFALRSFWTGFDAPGETCSCVALVRVPFEVPVDPPAIVRMAHLQEQGLNPFASFTLPMAKMMVRQGAGRLIRSDDDKGIIALLDPRLRAKRYGEEIIDNLPREMRVFDDFIEAAAWIGVDHTPVPGGART